MNTVILLSVLGVVAMMADIFKYRSVLWYIVLLGVSAGLILNVSTWGTPTEFYYMMYVDNYSVAFSSVILVLLLVWFLVSREAYLPGGEFNDSDHYALILFSSVGALLLTSFMDLSLMFLGIEILSIPLYVLAGSRKKDLASNESSLKYFLMGSFATGILLFGIALIYGATGSFNLERIGYVVSNANMPPFFYIGIVLVIIGLSFKISAVPFHFWTPDVYQGAPMFITAYMSTIVKTAAFAGFYRLFSTSFGNISTGWQVIAMVIITATLVVGNLIAVYQTSVKRMLAYSGVAQAGYMLLSILVLNMDTKTALLLYLASYGLSTLAAFTVLYHVQKSKGDDSFDSFASLGKTNPFLAIVMTVAMLSLAGIPPAVGFFAKFYLFTTVLKGNPDLLWLIGVAIFGSLVSVYYYFRVIIKMYAGEQEGAIEVPTNLLYKVVLVALVVLIIVLGLSPGMIVEANL